MSTTLAPCIVCGRELEDASAGNNQPVASLAFECHGHWSSSIFDSGGRDGWLEINVCEPCLHTATSLGRVLNGARADHRSLANYTLWKWPQGGEHGHYCITFHGGVAGCRTGHQPNQLGVSTATKIDV